jgi:hypothetical protein
VPIATNITQLQFEAPCLSPLDRPVVYATPSGNPDDACLIGTNTSLAGKIVLLDRGATNCNSAFKASRLNFAGAVAVLETTPGDTGYPFRSATPIPMSGYPVLVIAESYGAGVLKSYLTNGTPVTATIRGDANPRLAEWDGPKGFGAVDVTFGLRGSAGGHLSHAIVYPPGSRQRRFGMVHDQS